MGIAGIEPPDAESTLGDSEHSLTSPSSGTLMVVLPSQAKWAVFSLESGHCVYVRQ